MKYNKIVSLLALGSLFGPTLLASQQAFAEESSTVASNSAATSSSQQTTESSSTGETGSSEAPDPTPTEPTPEPAKQYNLLANGSPIANNTVADANGNQISFQYTSNEGLVAGTTVHYVVSLVKGYTLKEVKIINTTTQAIVSTSGNINGQFPMPDSDVSIQFEVTPVKEEAKPTPTPKPAEKPSGNTGNSNSGNKDKPASNPSSTTNSAGNSSAANQEQQAARQPEAAAADVRIPSIKMHQPSVMRFKRQSFKRHTAILESLMFGELKVRMLLTVQGLLMLYMPMRLVIISAVGQGISNTRGRKFLSVKHSLVICYFGEHQRV